MLKDVYMSCGHRQTLDMFTTGEQLNIDLKYYATQGLCSACWKRLIAERAAERAELQEQRRKKKEADHV